MKVIPTDIYNNDGDMVCIEFHDLEGEFVIKADWDPTDEQTSANRIAFRKWAYRIVGNMGYEVAT